MIRLPSWENFSCHSLPWNPNLVACGGMSCCCDIYDLKKEETTPILTLKKHKGYVASCVPRKKVDGILCEEQFLLTSSGDGSCILWDISTGEYICVFKEHDADVMKVDWSPVDPNCFASCSVDCSVKIWDLRSKQCTQSFRDHESDVKTVSFFPSGSCVASGSDDGTCKLFDLRADRQLVSYDRLSDFVACIEFSQTGKVLFTGYDSGSLCAWNTLSATNTVMSSHKEKIACMGLSPSGLMLATGSWDASIQIWT